MGIRAFAQPGRQIRVSVHVLLMLVALGPMVLASIFIGLINLANSKAQMVESTDRLFGETATLVADKVSSFLGAAQETDRLIDQAIGDGSLEITDVPNIEANLLTVLRSNPGISSVYIANAQGGLVDAGREGPDGTEYIIETTDFAPGTFTKYSINHRGRKTGVLSQIANFDARSRPWFKAAVRAKGMAWTDVFPLFTGQDLAISACCPVYGLHGELLAVVSVDLFLSHLGDFVRGLDSAEQGLSFIVDRDGYLIASPTDTTLLAPRSADGSIRRLRADESDDARIAGAAGALVRQQARSAPNRNPFPAFRVGKEGYLASSEPLVEPSSLGWKIVTIFPESVYLGSLDRIRDQTVGSVIVAVLLFGLFSILITALISARVRRFSAFADAVADGRWEDTSDLKPSSISEIEAFRGDLVAMRERIRKDFESLRDEIELRKRSEAELDQRRKEKELLLHEVHHRIKNNMYSMMSLLSMQAQASDDSKVREALGDAESRLASMMLLYNKLYRSESVSAADAAVYISDIADSVAAQYGHMSGISVDKRLEGLVLDAGILMPLGILVNEIITNSYKHAFPDGGAGRIGVELSKGDAEVTLVVADDGRGFAEQSPGHGFGLAVIDGLVGQLGGRLRLSTKGGTRYEIRFPAKPAL